MKTQREEIKSAINALMVNFSITKKDEDLKVYINLMDMLITSQDIDIKSFKKAVFDFMLSTSGNNFNKLPSIGDILSVLNLAPLSLDQKAEKQAEIAFNARYKMNVANSIMFDDAHTNYVIENTFGGFDNFFYLFASDNSKARDEEWGKKDFIKAYIRAVKGGSEINKPLSRTVAIKDIYNPEELRLFGDEGKIKDMMQMIEHKPANQETVEQVKLLAKKMRA